MKSAKSLYLKATVLHSGLLIIEDYEKQGTSISKVIFAFQAYV